MTNTEDEMNKIIAKLKVDLERREKVRKFAIERLEGVYHSGRTDVGDYRRALVYLLEFV